MRWPRVATYNRNILISLIISIIIVVGVATAYHPLNVRGVPSIHSTRSLDGFEEDYAAYLYTKLLLKYYEVNGVANRLSSINLYPPLEFHDYMKIVEDILSSLDILMESGDYRDAIELSSTGLEVLRKANETLNKFMMDEKPIGDSFYYYRQWFSRIYNNTLILLEIAEGIQFSDLDNLIPLDIDEVRDVYSIARDMRYNLYRHSIFDLESSARYLERKIYRYYYILGINEGDISWDVEESDVIRRVRDLNSRLLDTYNLMLEMRYPRSNPVFKKLDMLRKVLDDAETLLLSKGDIYYAQYIIMFCDRQLTFVDRVISNKNIMLESVKGYIDNSFIRFKDNDMVLLVERSIPRIYIYFDENRGSYRVTVSLLTLFRDLDGDGYMDENEVISLIYLDELNWTMWFNESPGSTIINYAYTGSSLNITLSFRISNMGYEDENTDVLEECLVSLYMDVKHVLGGEEGLRLGVGILVTPGAEDLNGAIFDYITVREAIFDIGSSRWYFSIMNGRWADVDGVYEPINIYIEEPKCCRKSLLYMGIVDYESPGDVKIVYKYYVGASPLKATSIIDIIPVIILFGLIFSSVILLIYLYKKGLVDFSRLTRVPISR